MYVNTIFTVSLVRMCLQMHGKRTPGVPNALIFLNSAKNNIYNILSLCPVKSIFPMAGISGSSCFSGGEVFVKILVMEVKCCICITYIGVAFFFLSLASQSLT